MMSSPARSATHGIFALIGLWCLAATPARAGQTVLTIGTYNVCVDTANVRETAAVVRKIPADVVVLQEVSDELAPQLSKTLSSVYRYRYFAGTLGIVSRYPLTGTRVEASVRGNNGFLFTTLQVRGQRVQIVDLHLDPLHTWTLGQQLTLPWQFVVQSRVQKSELEQVLPHLAPDVPSILLGDFNRGTDGAIHRLRRLGYIDSFASVTPHADRVSTLRFDVLGIPMTKRIDFIFHDPTLQTIRSQVIPGKPSDHDALTSALILKK
jgi:endonuclease/exonuclease/phosphatase (EEP) superfamily protein YafD